MHVFLDGIANISSSKPPLYISLISEMMSSPRPSPQSPIYHQYCQVLTHLTSGMMDVLEDFCLADVTRNWYETLPYEYTGELVSKPTYGDEGDVMSFVTYIGVDEWLEWKSNAAFAMGKLWECVLLPWMRKGKLRSPHW